MSEPANQVETAKDFPVVEKFRIAGDRFPTVGYLLECPGCKRKIVVETAINGTDHNISVSVTCGECVNLEELSKSNPSVAGQIAIWLCKKDGL
jgi:hypothetical protein